MRPAPVLMFFADDTRKATDRRADSSRTTHGAVEAVDAYRYFAGLLVGALGGVDKQAPLSERYCPVKSLWDEAPLAPRIAAIAGGSFKRKQTPLVTQARPVTHAADRLVRARLPVHVVDRGAFDPAPLPRRPQPPR